MVLLRKVACFGWIDYLCIGPRHAHATWRASDGNRPDSRTESLLYLRENLDRIRSDPGYRVNAVIIQEPRAPLAGNNVRRCARVHNLGGGCRKEK